VESELMGQGHGREFKLRNAIPDYHVFKMHQIN